MKDRNIDSMIHDGARNKQYGSIAKFWQQRLIAALPAERKHMAQTMDEEVVRHMPLPLCTTTTENAELLIFADGSGLMVGLLNEQGDVQLVVVHQVVSLD
jgi:hypothetical protein